MLTVLGERTTRIAITQSHRKRGQRHTGIAQRPCENPGAHLRFTVSAIPGARIDICRDQDLLLVVVAQRLHAQAGHACELTDTQHGSSLRAPPTGGSTRRFQPPDTNNDHADPAWDARILDELAELSAALTPLIARLTDVLTRFAGYDTLFDAALRRAQAGRNEWVDRTDIDSCHHVWFQLHEDLLATLSLDRGTAY